MLRISLFIPVVLGEQKITPGCQAAMDSNSGPTFQPAQDTPHLSAKAIPRFILSQIPFQSSF
jgi:hypothetical protein